MNNVLGGHHFRLIDLKVRHVLAIVGLGGCLLFFIVLPFSAITILVSNFVTVATGVAGAIAEGRPIGFALAFRSTFVTFACPFAFIHAIAFVAVVVGTLGGVPSAFTFFTFVSPRRS